MLRQNIRLRFSGLVVFASKGFSLLTGLIFVITVTRNLSSYDFGVWQNIGDMVIYFVILAQALPNWMYRYVARGREDAAATGFFSNLTLSVPFAVAWLFFAPQFAKIAGSQTIYYLFGSLMIVPFHLTPILEAIARAKRPSLIGIDLIVHEVTKVFVGLILVMFLKFGLLGALVAVISSNFADILFYLITLRGAFQWKVNWAYLRNWLRCSPISILSRAQETLTNVNFILIMIYSGAVARGYLGAVYTITASLSFASSLGIGLSPKILMGGNHKDVETTIKLVYMFGIPMVAGAIVLSEHLLTILNSVYSVASPVLRLAAISILLSFISPILDIVLKDTERIDETSFNMVDLMKSRLLWPTIISYFVGAVKITILYILLSSFKPSPLDAIMYFVALGFVSFIVWFPIKYVIARKYLAFKFPVKDLFKYSFSAIIMAILLSLLNIPMRISMVLAAVCLGALIYLTILMTIDSETRKLAKLALAESKNVNWRDSLKY